ncbi:MAG: BTAD domain-containing putative transcriptional regulator [Bacillota bacterium]
MRNEELSISTLGNFEVFIDSEKINTWRERFSKRWKLFQYLITFRHREVAREELIMNLNLNSNQDPEGSLSALVYRLRNLLEPENTDFKYIKTRGSAYTFNTEADYWLDVEEFEKLCHKAGSTAEKEIEEAISFYEQAVELYKGEYLEELTSAEWNWSLRNRYRELLVNTLLNLDEGLSEKNLYNELWQLYNQVQQRIDFDERIIKGAIEALIKDQRWGMARSKYEEVVALYQNNDLRVPPEIRKLESKLGNIDDDPKTLVEYFQTNVEAEGAFVCNNRETFSNIYELEKRKQQRDSPPAYLIHLRLTGKLGREQLIMLEDKFLKLLSNQLRPGDVVCPWDSKHFIILLTDITEKKAKKVRKRLINSFMARFELPEELIIENKGYEL